MDVRTGDVYRALVRLSNEHEIWRTNAINFGVLSDAERARWWHRAKYQAEQGVPAMQELVLKVIEVRMKK